ncbi:hypothetical protein BDW59DRAFT_164238 [Aspergillus cavernicola]|uniref:Polyketide synthase n=1 Tax=Aspergillus cavernicola TaxID=176166 RepID=A0ABR4I0T4_9EURO
MEPSKSVPIAIVGMSFRFPGDVNNQQKLWELCAERRSAWSEIPKGRFNGDGFLHPSREHLGTFNAKGGHFLAEDVAAFDAPFFSLTADIAKSMDPQLRLLLETVFEAFEHAGLPIEKVAGTKTAVFAGTCFRDYHDMAMRDLDTLPKYYLSGNMLTMTANRVSHFFDLRGPSVSLDTACSTSLTALHLACQALRAGEAETAVIAGSNLILHPGTMIGLSTAGLLGQDGKSYSFDDRAEGYGRGEGVAGIIIRPLADAMKNGDPICAVIRETAINQDGKTLTITSPSQEAQEQMVRECYERAGLNPIYTPYVEAHGTGTIAGDTIELKALGSTLGAGRPADKPLLVGSIKSNIGHLEATSGMAAIVKAVQMLQHGQIPPQALLKTLNPQIDFEHLHIKIPTELQEWPADQLRRVSINNFGAGGANAHVIMEDVSYHRNVDTKKHPGLQVEEGYVLMWSANDERGARKAVQDFASNFDQMVTSEWKLSDLAYTLCQRRSVFSWRIAVPASSLYELKTAVSNYTGRPVQAPAAGPPRLGFIFTGQGSQWFAMGRGLRERYPIFSQSLDDADRHLRTLGAPWSLEEELSRDEQSSKVNEASLSFPLTVIIQLAIVRLLSSWGVTPNAVTGHSSGEIAAAYAAGALNFNQAITVAYLRGKLTHEFVNQSQLRGGMIALSVGKEEAKQYMCDQPSKKSVVACVNSPSSVTISGDLPAIEEIEAQAAQNHVFARRLVVAAAYHSHHMELLAEDYLTALDRNMGEALQDEPSGVLFSSPVTGDFLDASKVSGNPAHWVRNMTQCVLFEDCLRAMLIGNSIPEPGRRALNDVNVDMLIEIGPHGALKGPVHQTLKSLGEALAGKIPYASCLTRGQDACQSIQSLAGWLYCHGYPVSLEDVNFPRDSSGSPTHRPKVIQGLTPYPWNHSVKYWHQSMVDKDTVHRDSGHELLGSRVQGLSPDHFIWRNIIRETNLPWLREHLVQSGILFPGAGLMIMAIEAMRQISSVQNKPSASGFQLHDVDLFNALIVPYTAEGSEVQLSVHRPTSRLLDVKGSHREFSISSRSSQGKWIGHCTGNVAPAYSDNRSWIGTSEVPSSIISSPLSTARFYQYLQRVGPTLGPAFQLVTNLMAGEGHAVATVTVPDDASDKFWAHPATLDACFHSAYAAVPEDRLLRMGISIPTSVRSLQVCTTVSVVAGDMLTIVSFLKEIDEQGFEMSLTVYSKDDHERYPVLKAEGLYFRSLGADAAADIPAIERNVCLQALCRPDVSLLSSPALRDYLIACRPGPKMVNEWKNHEKKMQLVMSNPPFLSADEEALKAVGVYQSHDPFYTEYIARTQWLHDIRSYVRLYSHKNPNAHVLEINNGNGLSSTAVIQGLKQDDGPALWVQQYDITEKSMGQLNEMRNTLPAYNNQIRYRTLDIDQDPCAQGFEQDSYDMVIISNMMPLLSSLEHCLRNTRKLIKPGGKLLLLNPEHSRSFFCHGCGSLSSIETDWAASLFSAGFSGFDIALHHPDGSGEEIYSTILTTALDTQVRDVGRSAVTLIVSKESSPPHPWLQQLARSLQLNLHLSEVSITQFGCTECIEGKHCIFLADLNEPILPDISSMDFGAFKDMLKQARGILWISRAGLIDGGLPEGALHLGLLRTLRMEDLSKRYIALDLDPMQEVWTAISVNSIIDVFKSTLEDYGSDCRDFEFFERKGQVHVPRLMIDPDNSNMINPFSQPQLDEHRQPFHFQGPCLRLKVQKPGHLNSLEFINADEENIDFAKELMEIEPRAFGLNFRDVMVAMGQMENKTMGFECAGIVTHVSEEASQRNFRVGDRVCALLPFGHWTNRVQVPWTGVAHIPDDMSFKMAASIPMAFATAYHALINVAHLAPNETVLIHAGAGGVGQAAIIIAQYIGARIFATVGSKQKVEFLTNTYGIPPENIFSSRDKSFMDYVLEKTNGKGVDVVLNSLAGDLLKASWDCIGMFGRFVELGKRDLQLNKYLEMRHFSRSVMYTAIDIVQLGIHKGKEVTGMLERIVELLRTKTIISRIPIATYGLGDLEHAFRLMSSGKHTGKIVITAEESDLVPMAQVNPTKQLQLNGSHLIVGGLTGIGREIAKWLATKGAKYLILMSRNAETSDSKHFQAELLQATGTRALLLSGDVANMADVQRGLTECERQSFPPIKGVIQAAAVLQDAMFDNMTHEQWEKAIRPKLHGTRNLHECFQSPQDLDYFIMLSSVTAIVGSLGQANYTAGGTYQDVLALTRQSQGLPATSIDLGSVLSAGIAARTKGIHERLERSGYCAHEIREVLSLVASAIDCQQPKRAQIITGLAQWTLPGDIPWRHESRFFELGLKPNDDPSSSQRSTLRSTTAPLKDRLKGLSASESDKILSLLVEAIGARLAEMFSLSESEIDPETPLSRYGVDSLVAVELRNWMMANIVSTVSIFDLTQSVSLVDLAKRVGDKLG